MKKERGNLQVLAMPSSGTRLGQILQAKKQGTYIQKVGLESRTRIGHRIGQPIASRFNRLGSSSLVGKVKGNSSESGWINLNPNA